MKPPVFILLILLQWHQRVSGSLFADFSFVREPRDTVVLGNEATVLECEATGSPRPKIRWRRDGEYLQFPDADNRRQLLSNGSLYFTEVFHTRTKRPDEGLYQCVATVEGVGVIVSRTATLRVAALPEFASEPSDISIHLGQTAVFECSIPKATPAADTIQWLKDDQPFVLDHRMQVLPSGLLEISDVRLSDRGQYKCNVSNGEYHKISKSAKLIVKLDMVSADASSAPSFVARPRNAKVLEGSTLTLDCAANGSPNPFITWLKDGMEVDLSHLDSRFRKIGRGSLEIRNVRIEDEGTFQCRAENSEDSADAAAVVEVQVPPRFTRKPQNQMAQEKGDAELECEVESKPEATVQWYKNGDLIIESEYFQIVHGTNLKILGLVELDSGVYQCVASNPVGNIQASAQLKVKKKGSSSSSSDASISSPKKFSVTSSNENSLGESLVIADTPSAPRDVTAAIVATRFITLSWNTPTRINGEAIQGYSVLYKQFGSDRERVLNSTRGTLEEINIQGLSPGTKYIVRVVAFNENGAGESSEPLLVTTQDDIDVPGPVQHLHCRPTSSFSLLISWEKPVFINGFVSSYKLYYRQSDSVHTRSLDVQSLQHHLTDLPEYTEYTVWVSAFNANGEGAYSEEVLCRTMSDIPADPPQNVTIEADSSKSVIARWEPPPKESQNGLITGYKIRWRQKGKRRSEMVTTDGSRRLFAVTNLKKGRDYQIKLSALTVNGSGPATPWMSARTFETDLDESVVPDPPSSLKASASDDEIEIKWTPPRDNQIAVRGYTIGWGMGIPDEFTKVVDDKQRVFVIPNLKPKSEYVISLRAYNNIGDGRPIYESVQTREEQHFEPLTPLPTPYGLHAIVLSSSTVVLTWMDQSLPRNQWIPDQRYYIIRYSSVKESDRPKQLQYRNSTDLNCMIDDLRPNTEYEFSVKTIKGRRKSEWSMYVMNQTQEAAPSSPPRDLTVHASDSPDRIRLSWRPPKVPNGRINGYVIQYTNNRYAEDREWFVEAVVGDQTHAVIESLSPDTKYFFKMGARNNKGYGPFGTVVTFRTERGVVSDYTKAGSGISPVVLYAVFGVGAGIVLVLIVGAVIMIRCRCRGDAVTSDPKNYLHGETGAQREKLNPPPPDLWIGHDHLELKAMDGDETADTSLPDYRSGSRSGSSMDRSRNYVLPYPGTESERSFKTGRHGRLVSPSGPPSCASSVAARKIAAINGKPRVQRYLSKESVASSSIANGSTSSSTYIRSQYNLNPPPPTLSSHISLDEASTCPAHSPDDLPPPGYAPSDGPPSTIGDLPSSLDGGSQLGGSGGSSGGSIPCPPPQLPPTYLSSALSTSSGESSAGSQGVGRQFGNNGKLKSFSSVPAQGFTSQPPKSIVRPQPSSPLKRPLLPLSASSRLQSPSVELFHSGHLPSIADVKSPDVLHPQDGPCDCLTHPLRASLSTEELNAEMKNLEGLMKDLHSISGTPNTQVNNPTLTSTPGGAGPATQYKC